MILYIILSTFKYFWLYYIHVCEPFTLFLHEMFENILRTHRYIICLLDMVYSLTLTTWRGEEAIVKDYWQAEVVYLAE